MLLFNRLLLLLFLFLNKSSLQNQAHNFTWKLLDAGVPIEFYILYDTMKGASLEENLCCYFFFTILNHDILNAKLDFKSYLNISRNFSARTLRIQPISACLLISASQHA